MSQQIVWTGQMVPSYRITSRREFFKELFRQRIIIAGISSHANPLTVKKAIVPNAMIHGFEHTDTKTSENIEDSVPIEGDYVNFF